jgi:hypothetical protein
MSVGTWLYDLPWRLISRVFSASDRMPAYRYYPWPERINAVYLDEDYLPIADENQPLSLTTLEVTPEGSVSSLNAILRVIHRNGVVVLPASANVLRKARAQLSGVAAALMAISVGIFWLSARSYETDSDVHRIAFYIFNKWHDPSAHYGGLSPATHNTTQLVLVMLALLALLLSVGVLQN